MTKKGKALAALISIKNSDMEAIRLSTDPGFMRLIFHSRARYEADGGLPAADVRRSLGLDRPKRALRKRRT